ncbi:MAG: hypothetical protein ABIH24_08245 [Verrucomicrobiota bacterium]
MRVIRGTHNSIVVFVIALLFCIVDRRSANPIKPESETKPPFLMNSMAAVG